MLRNASFLLACVLSLVAGCGGDASEATGTGGSGGDSGSGGSGAGSGSGGNSSCPDAWPRQGTPCAPEGLNCSYDSCCPVGATCENGVWETWASGCAVQECPELPPATGDSCECFSSPTCTYAACATDGTMTTASCTGTTWQVTSEACVAFPCGDQGLACNPGEICVGHAGGAPGISYVCEPNPCGSQPVACECAAASVCGATDTCTAVSAQELTCGCLDCP